MVLLISYDLNNHERPSSYKAVRAVIERYAISARKPLYSQWLVETQDSAQTWSDRIRAVADDDDRWLTRMDTPEVHYARSGGVAIAYQVVGDGPQTLVFAERPVVVARDLSRLALAA